VGNGDPEGGNVYFDLLHIRFTRGKLKEENHYYPFGLPMGDISGTADGFRQNRQRYQGNEYLQELGLDWMDFHARQYDPQIGRFLGVDPLADGGGQERFSPYAAMGNNPAMMVDPGGMQVGEMQVVPPHTLFKFFMPFSTFAMSRGKIDNDIKDVLAARQAALDYFKANAQAWAVILTGLYSSSGIVCNFGPDGGGGDKNELSNTNLVKFDDTKENTEFGTNTGASISLVYTGDVSGYEKTEWIQNVTTDAPQDGQKKGETYVDMGGSDGDKRYPFYYPKSVLEIVKIKEKNNGGVWYEDSPSRLTTQHFNRDYYFMAEATLIGYKNGSWNPIVSYGWGYSVKDGSNIIRTPINQTSWTSSFNSNNQIIK